jgi:hypothetical protein
MVSRLENDLAMAGVPHRIVSLQEGMWLMTPIIRRFSHHLPSENG